MTQENQTPELLPCPFCGGDASPAVGWHADKSEWHYVECEQCSAAASSVGEWSARTSPERAEPVFDMSGHEHLPKSAIGQYVKTGEEIGIVRSFKVIEGYQEMSVDRGGHILWVDQLSYPAWEFVSIAALSQQPRLNDAVKDQLIRNLWGLVHSMKYNAMVKDGISTGGARIHADTFVTEMKMRALYEDEQGGGE